MKKIYTQKVIQSIALFLFCSSLFAQPVDTSFQIKNKRKLPFGSDWALKKGIDLPLPFGISGFYTFMSRDIDVSDVSVELAGGEPQSISSFSSFAVRNKTSVAAIKFDTWVLPILNLYVLAGYATTDAKLDASVTIERPILAPVEIDIQTNTLVKGPYVGIGTSLVAGYKNWFMLGDANYGISYPDKLNNSINFTFISLRSGFSGKMGNKNALKAWFGGAYLNSKTTLEVKVPSDILGEVFLYIEQEPVNPWTAQCGFMLTINKSLEIMTEIGTNFKDASVSVVNVAYRF